MLTLLFFFSLSLFLSFFLSPYFFLPPSYWRRSVHLRRSLVTANAGHVSGTRAYTARGYQAIKRCTEAVERCGLDTEGLFRLAGIKSKVSRVCAVLQHRTGKAGKSNFMLESQDTLTSAIKQYFREADEPLLVPYDKWLAVVRTTAPATQTRIGQWRPPPSTSFFVNSRGH